MDALRIKEMVDSLPLGKEHQHQQNAVAAALGAMLVEKRTGVVLADEVGFGKTYEALAVMAHLCTHAQAEGKPFDHVLVLCKKSLLRKWLEESDATSTKSGICQYLRKDHHLRKDHPVIPLLHRVHLVDSRQAAHELRRSGLKGKLRNGGVVVPKGLYIVNHDLLKKEKRNEYTLLRQIWETTWDLVVVDEAHHFAKPSNRPSQIFAPDGNLRNYNQGIKFQRILALTATPFELDPQEIVNLLAVVRAKENDLKFIEEALKEYVKLLGKFFDRRHLDPTNPQRTDVVAQLRGLRDGDHSAEQGSARVGLQDLLCRYVIRNTMGRNVRRYSLVSKQAKGYGTRRFSKLPEDTKPQDHLQLESAIGAAEESGQLPDDKQPKLQGERRPQDLQQCVKESPLLPFDGPDALFYLSLREVIQETVEEKQDGVAGGTFIPMDLHQGLSSYPQIEKSALLQNRHSESAQRLKKLLRKWNTPKSKSRRLHPKVRALVDVIKEIATAEVDKVRQGECQWFSKVLVFNKLIHGTAPHLREEVSKAPSPIFDAYLMELIGESQSLETLRTRFRARARHELEQASKRMFAEYGESCRIPEEFQHEEFRKFLNKPFWNAFREVLVHRSEQTLFMIRAVRCKKPVSEEAIAEFIVEQLVKPVEEELHDIVKVLREELTDADADDRLDRAEEKAVILLEKCRSVDLVGRYDGANVRDRESHRRNFNDFYNPFVLLVSRVGEEGIDLQQQCRYIIHYDLEWNPAKMEQREGRVDRIGWLQRNSTTREGCDVATEPTGPGKDNADNFIDVRFMLLKGTYEERIFHTVMQRDQWFQILIGSKRRELGKKDPDDETDSKEADEKALQDGVQDSAERGRLSEKEMEDVMLNLQPPKLNWESSDNDVP